MTTETAEKLLLLLMVVMSCMGGYAVRYVVRKESAQRTPDVKRVMTHVTLAILTVALLSETFPEKAYVRAILTILVTIGGALY